MIKKITAFFLITFSALTAQSLDFFQEKIVLKIMEGSFEVIGVYHFRNQESSNYNHSLYYPFVIDETTCFPFEIYVYEENKNIQTSFTTTKTGICFPINVSAGDTNVYIVQYKQKISGNKAEYILTTTAQWGKPLILAEYIVIVPVEYEGVKISLPYNMIETVEGNKIFRITRKYFIPDKNLIIEWKGESN